MARELGYPLMPWQQHVADVALEIDPVTGLFVYREITLTVPRQSGKTSLMLALMVHRANGIKNNFFDDSLPVVRQNILYTAQTRNAARAKWEDEHVKTLEASRYGRLFRTRLRLGSEAILWHNGSKHSPIATKKTSGHGETLDFGNIDEAFAHESDSVEQAFKPAMITRPQPQLWITSTAGDAKSGYLRGKVDAGRDHALHESTRGVAYFEWSAPNESDPADLATWRQCMPALGHTVSEDAIYADFTTMKLPEFRRAYLNQWSDEFPDPWLVIEEADWLACLDRTSRRSGGFVIAIDMTPERSFTSIAMCGRRLDGKLHIEIMDHRPGSEWVPERLKELVRKHSPRAVVIDPSSPAGSLIEKVEIALDREVTKPSARDYVQACGWLYDAVRDGEVVHIGQPMLTVALSGAAKRDLGDAWAWARKGVSVDVSPAVSVTLASWGMRMVPDDEYDLMESVR